MAPLIHSAPHPCPWTPSISPLAPQLETLCLTQMVPAEFPGKGRSTDWGFEGQIGVDNTWKERLFYLYPWTIVEGREIEEGKEDGIYLVAPPPRERELGELRMTLSCSNPVFFSF